MSDWDKWFEEVAVENRRQSIAAEASAMAKAAAERKRHVELGWITENGEPGPNAPQDDDGEDEDEDGEPGD
jgi:hypothetical protein